jgi:hypothetical protein
MAEPSTDERTVAQLVARETGLRDYGLEPVPDSEIMPWQWTLARDILAALGLPDDRKAEEGRRLLLAIEIAQETRAAVAEEIAAELDQQAGEFDPGVPYGLLKAAARTAREHGRTDREEQA